MKLIISKKGLKEALIVMSKIISGKSTLPIVGAVKINSDKNGVTVSGTNLEEYLTCKIEGSEGGGSFIINLKELKDYLKQGGTSATVEFEDVGDKIAAIYHAGNIPVIKQFNCLPFDDWPKFSEARNKWNKIPRETLECIQKVIPFAAGKNDTRKTLQGIFMESDAVVATNGKYLTKLYCNTGIKKSMILPATKFIKSAGFAKSGDATISVEANDVVEYCTIKTDQWTYSTKATYGNYPNYKQVIPKSSHSTLELNKEAIEYLNKEIPMMKCSDEEHNTIHLYTDHNTVKIFQGDLKGATLNTAGTFRGSNPVAVSLNRDLLLNAFNLGFRNFDFMDDPFSPVTASKKGKGIYVFMPLRYDKGKAETIIEAVLKAGGGVAYPVKESGSNAKSVVPGKNPVVRSFSAAVNAIDNKPERQTNKEKKKMPEETQSRRPVFKVVEGTEQDSFEDLLTSIMEVRVKAKEVFDMTGTLSKKVKDAQRAQKAKEKDFKQTKDLLGKLKKVSGF